MIKKIGLETSSILPLIETTPRTLPLQKSIKKVTNKYKVEFYTDLYSVKEAIQQITTSFTNAKKSIEKLKLIANKLNTNNTIELTIIFVKTLSENWYAEKKPCVGLIFLLIKNFNMLKREKNFLEY